MQVPIHLVKMFPENSKNFYAIFGKIILEILKNVQSENI